MTTEDVKIVVSAEDKASTVFSRIGRSINDTSNTTKKLGGVLVDVFQRTGSGLLAGIANEVRQLSDAIGDATDNMHKGRVGAIGMKVAVAGIAGAVGYQLGNAINEWVLGASKFRVEMEAARAASEAMASGVLRQQSRRFAEDMERIALMNQGPAKDAAYKQQLDNVKSLIKDAEKEVERFRAREKEIASQFIVWTGMDKESLANAQANTAEKVRQVEALKQQRDQMAAINSEHAKEIQAIKQRQDAERSGDATIANLKREIARIEDPRKAELMESLAKAANSTQMKKIEMLVKEKHALEDKIEADKTAAELLKQNEEDEKRREALKKLEQQVKPVRSESFNRSAAQDLQGLESRVLSGRPSISVNYDSITATNTTNIAKTAEESLKVNQEILNHLRRHGSRALIGIVGA